MKRVVILLCLIGLAAAITGCKLALMVGEGGEVQSTGLGTCVAGTICTFEVNDTEFDHIFTAVPATGWYFDKWISGDRFFCGNSRNPECGLYFIKEARSDAAVKQLVASPEEFYLMPLFKECPTPFLVEDRQRVIEVEGERRQWLLPSDFVGYSYDQVSKVCPAGVCQGTLPDSRIDLTGYTWASSEDLAVLFLAYHCAGKAVRDHFGDTFDFLGLLIGLVSDEPEGPGELVTPVAADDASELFPVQSISRHEAPWYAGVWFWRPID